MRADLPVEDEDLARPEAFAQMVVGAAVAEAELENRAVGVFYDLQGVVQAGTLCLESADEAVEAAQAAART